MRRKVRGDRSFRRLIKQLPQEVEEAIRAQLHETGKDVLTQQQSRAAVRTGKLKAGLSYRVPPKALRLSVGLVGKPINRKLFYGRFVEYGRKAQTVIVARKGVLAQARKLGGRSNAYKNLALKAGIKGTYTMKIRGRAPRPFIYAVKRDDIYQGFKSIWDKALNKAAAGAGDD